MPDSSPFLTIATALQLIIADEFSAEGITAILDNLHESLGRDRVDVGIAPIEDFARENNELVQDNLVEIRFYDLWTQEIDPGTVVDPSKITGYAERLKKAIFEAQGATTASGEMWYFTVRRTQYPNDPTGNKTRFHMQVRGIGNNAGLTESS